MSDKQTRDCPQCGRETKQMILECKVCQSERVLRAAPHLFAAGRIVLESGAPHPVEHPKMHAAFEKLRAAVELASPREIPSPEPETHICPNCGNDPYPEVDVCDECDGDFGLSGEDHNGYNSTCCSCGKSNIYHQCCGKCRAILPEEMWN